MIQRSVGRVQRLLKLREQRVALAYHTVSAPTAGIVGDIPVRVGDRVTKSTLLTTIDESAGLELYISVPVQEAAKLRVGLPVRLEALLSTFAPADADAQPFAGP